MKNKISYIFTFVYFLICAFTSISDAQILTYKMPKDSVFKILSYCKLDTTKRPIWHRNTSNMEWSGDTNSGESYRFHFYGARIHDMEGDYEVRFDSADLLSGYSWTMFCDSTYDFSKVFDFSLYLLLLLGYPTTIDKSYHSDIRWNLLYSNDIRLVWDFQYYSTKKNGKWGKGVSLRLSEYDSDAR